MSTHVQHTAGLEAQGIEAGRVFWNLNTAALTEEAIRRHEGVLGAEGPLVDGEGALEELLGLGVTA